MCIYKIIFIYIFIIGITDGSHFLGGTITWRPLNESATGSPVAIVITQTYLFNYTSMKCSTSMVASNSYVPDWSAGTLLSASLLKCIPSCGAGSGGYANTVHVIPRCTDFSIPGQTTVWKHY